jgi:hypothetical protein
MRTLNKNPTFRELINNEKDIYRIDKWDWTPNSNITHGRCLRDIGLLRNFLEIYDKKEHNPVSIHIIGNSIVLKNREKNSSFTVSTIQCERARKGRAQLLSNLLNCEIIGIDD